ncbi:hypothetical protein [Lichenihabitans psoromatis]|uniref:hypothetical protein n=1 Tax=Lichenihabitans psoromatis TaxID=2528642 RepID=UPI001FE09F6E|nr:hypothetical protein [Lichenihabitans psoromatis]
MRQHLKTGATALMISTICAAAGAPSASARAEWLGSPLGRMEVLALLQTLSVSLLSHDSATLVLEKWCADHGLASRGSQIAAERVEGADKQATEQDRALLRISTDEPLRYRRVKLRCGDHVVSEADNWYVPARLTPAMNMALDTTDGSFGRIVQPLRFYRRTLASRLLWSPVAEGWDSGHATISGGSPGILSIPDHLIENRALLSLPDATPFSLVVETYTSEILQFTPPAVPMTDP